LILDKVPCAACGEPLIPAGGAVTHPGCPVPGLSPDDPDAEALRRQMIQIVKWADNNSPRSLQREIGPSEISGPCDRRIGYRLAGVPAVNNFFDSWPATVGTAVHTWLETAVQRWATEHGDDTWLTEQTLKIDDFVPAHSDLYHDGVVIDHKTANADKLKKIALQGIAACPEYEVQVQLYGKAYEQAGYPVRKVALIFYPRSGWLRDTQVWMSDYKPDIANTALDRMYAIAQRLLDLEVVTNPHRWEQVDATPSNLCGWCPLYDPNKILETGADDTGCPGR
jgi:hypothetical protein